jgi:transposase-like protein
MIKIVREIQAGILKKKGACRKYGLNRNTLVNWFRRLSVRTLQPDEPHELQCKVLLSSPFSNQGWRIRGQQIIFNQQQNRNEAAL